MKKLMMVLVLPPLMAAAETEVVDGIEWTYTVKNCEVMVGTDDGTIAIPSATAGAITIPSTLGGCPVTSIGMRAFDGCGGLTAVTMPSKVKSIGAKAFNCCGGLTAVMIPESTTSIDEDGAFDGCSGLMAVTVAEGNPAYRSDGGILYDKAMTEIVCCPGGKIGAVTIPAGVTSVRGYAFASCSGLTAVTIPSSVKSIGKKAFKHCSGLTAVTIPSSVKSIGRAAFGGCCGLTAVTVAEGNSAYCSVGGILYNKAMTEIVCYPSGKGAVTIHEGVKGIGEGAFAYCSGLTAVTIPSSVKSIGEEAFRDCSLTTVYVVIGDAQRVKNLMSKSGFDVSTVKFVEIDIPSGGGDEPHENPDADPGDWTIAHNFSGVVYDAGENCVGMIQIATKKATKKGVGVSGTMMFQDGKKITLKSMTVAPEGGVLNVSWTVKGYGKLNVAVGAEGFSGQFEDGGFVESQELDEDTGVLKASITMTYIDKKTGKMKTKKITFGGFVSDGEGIGTAQAGKKDPIKDVEFMVR